MRCDIWDIIIYIYIYTHNILRWHHSYSRGVHHCVLRWSFRRTDLFLVNTWTYAHALRCEPVTWLWLIQTGWTALLQYMFNIRYIHTIYLVLAFHIAVLGEEVMSVQVVLHLEWIECTTTDVAPVPVVTSSSVTVVFTTCTNLLLLLSVAIRFRYPNHGWISDSIGSTCCFAKFKQMKVSVKDPHWLWQTLSATVWFCGWENCVETCGNSMLSFTAAGMIWPYRPYLPKEHRGRSQSSPTIVKRVMMLGIKPLRPWSCCFKRRVLREVPSYNAYSCMCTMSIDGQA